MIVHAGACLVLSLRDGGSAISAPRTGTAAIGRRIIRGRFAPPLVPAREVWLILSPSLALVTLLTSGVLAAMAAMVLGVASTTGSGSQSEVCCLGRLRNGVRGGEPFGLGM